MSKRRKLLVFASSIGAGFFACRSSAPRAMPRAPCGFDDVAITISAHQAVDSPVSVLVQLAHPARLGKRSCFVAPADVRVTVDGQLLELTDRGGPARASRISGIEIPDPIGCRPAIARSPTGMRFEARATSTIVVEHGGKRGEVIASNILAKRTVRVRPSTTVRPGDRVTLEWTDRDRWTGDDLATTLSIYNPGEFSLSLDREQLDIAPPMFSFVVPPIRPGRALVTLYPGNLRRASQARCSGFHSCDAAPNDHHDQLELTIGG